MLNWLVTYQATHWPHCIRATLIEENPRVALDRLRKDDRMWVSFDVEMISARPVMAPKTPAGRINFRLPHRVTNYTVIH